MGLYENPIANIVTSQGSLLGTHSGISKQFVKLAPIIASHFGGIALKGSKVTMVLGPAGDLISIAGSVNNLVANPNSAEYWVDAAVSLIGFVPIAGDLNALVSYVFNTSCQAVLKLLNNGDYAGACGEMDINTSGGVYMQGLENRRQSERNSWTNGYN